jgi:hypothetical protein
MVERGQRGRDKVVSLLGNAQGCVGEAGGEVSLMEGRDGCLSSWFWSTGRRVKREEVRSARAAEMEW